MRGNRNLSTLPFAGHPDALRTRQGDTGSRLALLPAAGAGQALGSCCVCGRMSCLLRPARLSARWLFASAAAPCRRASRFNVPPSAECVARPVGLCSMLRLPVQTSAEGLNAAFVGVPIDVGTSNRPGAR